jgi:tRNA-dihydrouridine synthase B
MEKAARLAVELGFDGIDINMGCPDKSVEKQGAGAKLIQNPKLAQEIILAAKRGARIQRSGLGKLGIKGQTLGELEIPVSVKTRIGWNKDELETWLPALIETNPAVITIHARTRKELSLVPARWEHVKRAVEIRDEYKKKVGEENCQTLIFGNGDVVSVEDAKQKALETDCDGVMIGRAIFGNPWLFAPASKEGNSVSIDQKLRVLAEHTRLFSEIVQPKPPVGQGKSFAVMKKHFKAYVKGFPARRGGGDGAKELRVKLMECENAEEVEKIIKEYLLTLGV